MNNITASRGSMPAPSGRYIALTVLPVVETNIQDTFISDLKIACDASANARPHRDDDPADMPGYHWSLPSFCPVDVA